MAPPVMVRGRSPQRSATGPHSGGRTDAHPLPPRQVPGSHRVRDLDALRGDPDEVRAHLSEHIPWRRYGEPEEFGWAAAFVLSPAASRITGAMIPVDGGAIKLDQLAWRSAAPVCRAAGMLSRNPGE
jgi:hypothetical protein